MIKVAATEIVSGVSGESEEKLRSLFENAMVINSCYSPYYIISVISYNISYSILYFIFFIFIIILLNK